MGWRWQRRLGVGRTTVLIARHRQPVRYCDVAPAPRANLGWTAQSEAMKLYDRATRSTDMDAARNKGFSGAGIPARGSRNELRARNAKP